MVKLSVKLPFAGYVNLYTYGLLTTESTYVLLQRSDGFIGTNDEITSPFEKS
jgi:hypothetical protein